jgi:hypothetical protein
MKMFMILFRAPGEELHHRKRRLVAGNGLSGG